MEIENSVPILIVSAKDKDAASKIIAEIIGNELDEKELEQNELDRNWRISNKYYTADVRVHALLDGEDLRPSLAESVEAHVIYLSQNECNEEAVVDIMQRRSEASAALDAQVRLAAADARAAPAALAAACARARLELVPLREPAPDHDERDSDDERDECGLDRVRAALHALLWPGLVRRDRSDRPVVPRSRSRSSSESSDASWSEWCSGPAPGAGGSEAAYAAALGTLPGAAAAARACASRSERLARAEELLHAFCHALGTPLD